MADTAVAEVTSAAPVSDTQAPADQEAVDYGDGQNEVDALFSEQADTSSTTTTLNDAQETDSSAPPADTGVESTEVSVEAGDSSFDEGLLKRAERHGIDAEEAKAFGTPEALERAITVALRSAARFGEEQLAKLYGTQPEPQEAAAPPAQQTAQEQAAATIEKLKLDLNPEEFDEPAIKAFNSITEHYDSQLSQRDKEIAELKEAVYSLHEQHTQYTGRHQAEQSAQVAREMDTFFNGLGDEYADIYGKGESRHFAEGSPQRTARNKLMEKMTALALAEQYIPNRQASTLSELQKDALALLHSDKLKTAARKEILQKVRKRQGQAIAQPANRSKSSSGREAAVGFVSQFVRDNGVDESELEDF